jgi:hypothetical protein
LKFFDLYKRLLLSIISLMAVKRSLCRAAGAHRFYRCYPPLPRWANEFRASGAVCRRAEAAGYFQSRLRRWGADLVRVIEVPFGKTGTRDGVGVLRLGVAATPRSG